jgi:hypothetical protein
LLLGFFVRLFIEIKLWTLIWVSTRAQEAELQSRLTIREKSDVMQGFVSGEWNIARYPLFARGGGVVLNRPWLAPSLAQSWEPNERIDCLKKSTAVDLIFPDAGHS